MTEKELQQNYPAYSKSIFSDFMPDDSNVVGWQENVLQKVKGDSILPHYIKKDRDFDTFWGWITHFFAIIVYFCRKFKKIFTEWATIDYYDGNKLGELREFLRERDYIQDSRVSTDKDTKIILSEEVPHKIFCDTRLIGGVATPTTGYNTTDYIPIKESTLLILKVLGYNQSLGEYSGSTINNINLAFYSIDKKIIEYTATLFILANDAKNGYPYYITPSTIDILCFVRISYPRLGSSSLPLYLGVFLAGLGSTFVNSPFVIQKTEQDLFGVHSDFRKRGTFKGASLIKKILETNQEDGFYAGYLPQVNTGWFLNKTSPTFGRLCERVQIDSSIGSSLSTSSGVSTTITMEEKYFVLNQNTSLVAKWSTGKEATSVVFNVSVYDKDKNLLEGFVLSGWSYNSSNHILAAVSSNSISVYPRYNKTENVMEAELPIEFIDNAKSGVFSTDTYDTHRFLSDLNKICLFTKYDNWGNKEAYYIRITSVVLKGSNTPYINLLTDFKVELCLRKLPITMGFLNNRQYYLCCFKNNGSYSNAEAAEIISQKVIPYNGYRVFIDNTFYKDNTTIALDLKDVYFDKINKKIYLEIIGGVPPYTYTYDSAASTSSYLQTYENSVSVYGTHFIKVVDALDQTLLIKVSCQPYNDIDYRFKLFVGKDNSIQVFIKLLGGTETSYTISKYTYSYPYLYDNSSNQLLDKNNYELLAKEITESTGKAKVTIPANIWVDITSVIGSNFSAIEENQTLYIRDNGIPVEVKSWLVDEYSDLEMNLQELFCNFALDFYDNGVGELVD